MKVLVRNDDGIAVYAADNLILTSQGLDGDTWRDQYFTSDNSTLVEIELPDDWCPHAWRWTGAAWIIADPAIQANFMDAKSVIESRAVKISINQLEVENLMPRGIREALIAIMEKIFTADELNNNFGYKGIKQLDARTKALRAKIK
jgi:hypothetical protein